MITPLILTFSTIAPLKLSILIHFFIFMKLVKESNRGVKLVRLVVDFGAALFVRVSVLRVSVP